MNESKGRRQSTLGRVDELWWLYEHRDPNSGIDGRCTALVVDSRYVVDDRDGFGPPVEMRLVVSYGDNPFTAKMKCGFVPPPVLPGTHVFGIHQVGTRDALITMFDHWYDAREATGHETADEIERRAQEILASISDDEYGRTVGSGKGPDKGLRSTDRRIEDFEILPGESL